MKQSLFFVILSMVVFSGCAVKNDEHPVKTAETQSAPSGGMGAQSATSPGLNVEGYFLDYPAESEDFPLGFDSTLGIQGKDKEIVNQKHFEKFDANGVAYHVNRTINVDFPNSFLRIRDGGEEDDKLNYQFDMSLFTDKNGKDLIAVRVQKNRGGTEARTDITRFFNYENKKWSDVSETVYENFNLGDLNNGLSIEKKHYFYYSFILQRNDKCILVHAGSFTEENKNVFMKISGENDLPDFDDVIKWSQVNREGGDVAAMKYQWDRLTGKFIKAKTYKNSIADNNDLADIREKDNEGSF